MYNSQWYNNLTKPIFAPPDSIFTPAWVFLYLTVFTSLALYILKPADGKKSGYVYFVVQLGLNFAWSPAFFMMQNMALGLLIIIFMAIFTILTIREFYKVSKTSAFLLIPYLLWIIFATYLNIGYLVLN